MYQNQLSPAMQGTVSTPTDNQIAVQSMMAKEQSKIQGQVFMAKQFPRDMTLVLNKVKASCERQSLAQISEYEYPRGGQKIAGASIRLLEVVAQCYGNISYSWKELSRNADTHTSTILAFAWDLENNLYSELEFDVPHYRSARGSKTLLTDERDIYELIANQASRRVRRCLENVIPRDIVDEAREYCKKTLASDVDYQKKIDTAITWFSDNYNIKPSQIEKYFGMSRMAFTQNTYLRLQKIFTSLRDGMSKVDDYFPAEEETDKPVNSLKPKKAAAKEAVKEVTPPIEIAEVKETENSLL